MSRAPGHGQGGAPCASPESQTEKKPCDGRVKASPSASRRGQKWKECCESWGCRKKTHSPDGPSAFRVTSRTDRSTRLLGSAAHAERRPQPAGRWAVKAGRTRLDPAEPAIGTPPGE